MHLSFGVIFSIILIIAIIAVAFYVITNFLSLSQCSQIGLFYEDLESHINKAWLSTIHQDTFNGNLPSDIESVCFGNPKQAPANYKDEYNELLKYTRDNNVFLYPPKKACPNLEAKKIEHFRTEEFFCIPLKNNEIQIKTRKDRFDQLVTVYN